MSKKNYAILKYQNRLFIIGMGVIMLVLFLLLEWGLVANGIVDNYLDSGTTGIFLLYYGNATPCIKKTIYGATLN
ncbi:hypothetical protein [Enterococcus faecalis]|uniref:hypothetical protein n=1 Tax=Enterococcus faecalis TaxID=1351 RepID=UPI00206173FC|nr:hypothetical protein [Enterococcus faecalis]BDH63953.1 hypothetical protein MTP05_01380 [Enterococcus sp. PLM3]